VRLRAEQLESHLANALARSTASLAGTYLVHGDEPLLAIEAADAVRSAARQRGFSQREVFFVEKSFDWSAVAHAGASRSLFGDRSILELRFASGRVAAAAAQAIERYCGKPNPDVLLLISMPRPEGSGWWKSGWFAALDAAGVIVEAQPVARAKLAEWISQRLARQRQSAGAETLDFLADRVEGNLLAAQQEILKLALLAPEGELSPQMVEAAVSSVARYEFDTLAEALYAGDFLRYARALAGLRGEGETAAALAWRLGEELAALLRIKLQLGGGRRLEQLFAENRIWRAAQPRCEKALRRMDSDGLRKMVVHVARIERASKGAGPGDPWDELIRLGLELTRGTEVAQPVS